MKEAHMRSNEGSRRRRSWQTGGLLVLALVVPATLAQTRAPERVVTRPDGTTVQPFVGEETRAGRVWWRQDAGPSAEERERRRAETRQDAIDRQDTRMREREGALQNPARQIRPTVGY
jgi:hypothetical protein